MPVYPGSPLTDACDYLQVSELWSLLPIGNVGSFPQ
jgi:hypothetical protein